MNQKRKFRLKKSWKHFEAEKRSHRKILNLNGNDLLSVRAMPKHGKLNWIEYEQEEKPDTSAKIRIG